MARQEIILGTPPQGLGGDPPRTASMKINAMTQELFAALGADNGALPAVLPVAKGGTGRMSIGNAVGADVVASTTDATAGRLLSVGYGGLGADSANYPAASAADATVVGGAYLVPSSVVGTPYSGFWGMRVERAFSNYCLHDVWDLNDTNARYFAIASNGAFTGWNKYYHSGNTTRAADGTLKAI